MLSDADIILSLKSCADCKYQTFVRNPEKLLSICLSCPTKKILDSIDSAYKQKIIITYKLEPYYTNINREKKIVLKPVDKNFF